MAVVRLPLALLPPPLLLLLPDALQGAASGLGLDGALASPTACRQGAWGAAILLYAALAYLQPAWHIGMALDVLYLLVAGACLHSVGLSCHGTPARRRECAAQAPVHPAGDSRHGVRRNGSWPTPAFPAAALRLPIAGCCPAHSHVQLAGVALLGCRLLLAVAALVCAARAAEAEALGEPDRALHEQHWPAGRAP